MPSRPLPAAVLAAAVIAGLVAPAAASACGAARHASARAKAAGGTRSPLVIGDSTMLLAAPRLGRLGMETDARGCRQLGQGLAMVRARRRAGRLPHLVVIALGANGAINGSGIGRALRTVGRGRVLALVTPTNSGSTQVAMRRAAGRHPGRVLLIDWARYSAGRGWFAGDGLHVSYAGADAYARFIARRSAGAFRTPRPGVRLPTESTGQRACGAITRLGSHLNVYVIAGTTRITCTRARAVVREPPLGGVPGWRWWDARVSRRRPWTDIYAREDRKVVLTTVRFLPDQPAPPAPPPPPAQVR